MANYSKQREDIKNAVLGNEMHPTAEEVYEIVKKQNSSASLSTVYRNLSFLSQNGVIKKVFMENGSVRFDGTLSEHQHVVCEKCGELFDINIPNLDFSKSVKEQTGVKLKEYRVMMTGICEKCIKN